MSESTFVVKGMTCSGCMSKVTTAVTGVDGVTDVDVDISNGELTVVSDSPVDPEAIRKAVGDAGYEIAS
ncbi:heavy-metal-associated domain-containing protein [Saccharopolyspora indica]|uniref:Heavy-metal-associated domain-containing protein n=1 Tax=Saccharopolyspora hirsuta TaxID=1837 RepID=A0A5M7C7V0_SACHI|nr:MULTISPECIES: heavy metal-associated domain-containing protein [Saccharopolyspora]KAA5838082.1 heavy-metal-associated domain-containing protein [Saccharopolyspora hirsuta]MDA3644074.1 heavy metal-associated domain-containing protein [Saccharopolyspora indica]